MHVIIWNVTTNWYNYLPKMKFYHDLLTLMFQICFDVFLL